MPPKYRAALIEMAVEQDDAALESYVAGVEPSIDMLKACIRRGTIAGAFVPVTCGAAFKNKGIQPLLDAVVDFLPSPRDSHDLAIRPDDEGAVRRPGLQGDERSGGRHADLRARLCR